MKKIITSLLILGLLSFNSHAQELKKKLIKLSDAPEKNLVKNNPNDSTTYSDALKNWKSVKELNEWIGKNFHYDMSRAIALGSKRMEGPKTSIFTPEEMYAEKSGICVDLSRFAFETLKKISPETEAHYLMIDFEPIEIQGSIIRKHWVIAYKNEGKFYVTADSKRPGLITGPYESIEDFVEVYEKFRKRKIESFSLLQSYKKTYKKKLVKNKRKSENRDNQTLYIQAITNRT